MMRLCLMIAGVFAFGATYGGEQDESQATAALALAKAKRERVNAVAAAKVDPFVQRKDEADSAWEARIRAEVIKRREARIALIEETTDAPNAKPAKKQASGCSTCGPGCQCGPGCKCDEAGWSLGCTAVPAKVRAAFKASMSGPIASSNRRTSADPFGDDGYWLEGGFGPPPVPDGYTLRMNGNVAYLEKTPTAQGVPQRPFPQARPIMTPTTPVTAAAARSTWSNGSIPMARTPTFVGGAGIGGGTSGCASG